MNYKNDFYINLKKPKILPPSWVFKIVWPVLYILMFLSFFIMIFTKTDKSKISAIITFFIQLLFNFLWPFVFWGKRKLFLAFITAILLAISIFLMIKVFYSINPLSAYLNIPYFIWCCFACILMFFIYRLNKN